MENYHGINCPICGQPLEDGREIAVCPECGAPYHKECIQKRGSCCFLELHRLHESWQPDRESFSARQDSSYFEQAEQGSGVKCQNCGALNPQSGVFCTQCGAPLQGEASRQYRRQYYPGGFSQGEPGSQGSFTGQPFGGFGNFGAAATPFGGLKPDENVLGLPATDVALYVGQNTHYFLPRFKLFDQGKKILPNFAAFFFHGFYFLYRKMVLWGLLLVLMDVLLYTPTILSLVDAIQYNLNPDGPLMFNVTVVSNMSMISSMITIILEVLLCLFTNRLYANFCKRKIEKIKAEEQDVSKLSQLLQKHGGVCRVLIPILLAAFFALYIGIQYLAIS